MTFQCPHCQQPYTLTPDQAAQHAGHYFQCKRCGQSITVPEEVLIAELADAQPTGAHYDPPPPFTGVPQAQAAPVDANLAALSQAAASATKLDYHSAIRTPRAPSHFWSDFFAFRTMITVSVIQVVFVLGTILVVVGGVVMLANARRHDDRMLAMLYITGGPFALRLWCEFLIVVFRINETLTEIKNQQR